MNQHAFSQLSEDIDLETIRDWVKQSLVNKSEKL